MTCEALGHSLLIPNNYSRLFPFSAESKQLQSWFCPLSSFVFAFHTREAEGTEVVVLVHIRTRLCLLFEDVISLDAHAAAVHHWNLIILTLKWLKCPRAVIYNPVILFFNVYLWWSQLQFPVSKMHAFSCYVCKFGFMQTNIANKITFISIKHIVLSFNNACTAVCSYHFNINI